MKPVAEFNLLSNHGLALVCIAGDPGMRLRDIAEAIGVTERTAHSVVSDLVEGGFVKRSRDGVRNRYEIRPKKAMQDPLLHDQRVGGLLDLLSPEPNGSGPTRSRKR